LSIRLAERLKSDTRALHTAAERSRFMGTLLRGEMQRPAYCALLRNLHGLYATLEPALERHATDPLIAPVFAPALWRAASIEHDLRVLHGPHWATELPLHDAARDYCDRLVAIDARQAGLLLAHAYVRYLGDLSGGQMLRGIVAHIRSAHGASATSFYEFGDAQRTRELTLAFRRGLVEVGADEAQEDRLVDEARWAFEAHRALFEELAVACGLRGSDQPA
jgi:heme oxygenase